jgi:hypothetical protein
MSRWFRFYDDAVNDPKLLRLPDDLYRAWTILLCFASKNEGTLPPADDIALALRIKPAKVCEWITKLVRASLIDQNGNSFTPHNWNGRQYKSDSSNERVKRHREKKCNVTSTVTVTAPETEQIQTTEHSRPEARDEKQIRVGNFRQAIVKAYEAANSPSLPDTSRAELWITQGYQEDICLAVIAGIVPKKPNVGLSYFDNPIKEAHASKAPPRQAVPMKPEQVDWDTTLKMFKRTGYWSKWAGPDLESPACQAPVEMLEKYGLVSAHDAPAPAPALRSMQ